MLFGTPASLGSPTRMLLAGLSLFAALCPARALAQGEGTVAEVVVTATRMETAVDEVSGTILVVTAQDIQERQARTVADALAGLPGLDLVNQGGPGKATSALLRGGDARFTLVLVDGVEVNDPSNPERTFDLAHLSTEGIERIEVLFGPQGTLYGSDAIGGVIQVITRTGSAGRRLEVSAESGGFGSRSARASARGGGRASWSISASSSETDGVSAAAEADGNREADGYRNASLSGSATFELGRGGSLRLDARATEAENELDHSGGVGGDDPDFRGDAEHLLLGCRLVLFPVDRWESTLALSRNAHRRRDENRPDPIRDFTMAMDYSGRSDKVEWVNTLRFTERSVLTLGFDREEESGESSFSSDEFGPYTSTLEERSAAVSGIFLQERFTAASRATVTAGVRSDDHSRFGGVTTFRAGVSVPVARTIRLRAAYGTGFRAPSIDQLFNPDYGNPDLDAERSRGWDAGVETGLGSRLHGSVSLHRTDYDDLIDWYDADGDPSTWWDGGYRNLAGCSPDFLHRNDQQALAEF